MPRHWLVKSEPDVYSIDDLARDRTTFWDGVRNYQARNLMRDMEVGDLVLFYHSNANPPGVAGVARVSGAARPDPTALDRGSPYHDPKSTQDEPRWWGVDVEFVERFPRLVPLGDLKAARELSEMVVTKRSRLSVQPVCPGEFATVRAMGGTRDA
jgi:predicted RNA-binding protein with PUA-like domain